MLKIIIILIIRIIISSYTVPIGLSLVEDLALAAFFSSVTVHRLSH